MRRLRQLALSCALVIGCAAHTPAPDIPPAAAAVPSAAPETTDDGEDPSLAQWIREHYDKREVMIPMRDGVRLFTAIYEPKSRDGDVPILLNRTPYSVKPYGEGALKDAIGPSPILAEKGWVIVYQDVRGRYMSEGDFVDVRPHRKNKGPKDIDESTDTFDTVAWLVANVRGNNGKVGMWGISYPGFYAATGMIDAHPALRAVSPQAPIADWWFDDFHHHGAFFLPHAFNFMASFGRVRKAPTTQGNPRFDHGTPDGWAFFLGVGPLAEAEKRHFEAEVPFWRALVEHPDYDEFWRARDLLPHLANVAPAVMTVGGWFDAEDLYGPLQIYRAIEKQDRDAFNVLVMGPWRHGGWSRDDGRRLGAIDFGSETSEFYREHIEAPFFVHHLAGGKAPEHPEAWVFETGANRWRQFASWPPGGVQSKKLYLDDAFALADGAPTGAQGYDAWTSDPAEPVPFTHVITTDMTREYMVEDQRFAERRPDVLAYTGEPLAQDVTLAGPVFARLWVSTDRTDADFVVKLVDVFPDGATMRGADGKPVAFGGTQMLVRSEVFRARWRDGYEKAKPMKPGVPTLVEIPLQDLLHTFKAGHRIQVQVQSTWFPLVDRNPQKFVPNIYTAKAGDYVAAEHRVWRSRRHPTHVEVGVLPAGAK